MPSALNYVANSVFCNRAVNLFTYEVSSMSAAQIP